MEFKTLTPLWTGGAKKGKVDRIHETGLLGSIRWWYEVLVRGLGGEVCDPDSDDKDNKCDFKADKYNKSKAGMEEERLREAGLCDCDVCQVFGATGWKRRFRLLVVEKNVTDALIQHPMRAERTYKNAQGKDCTPTWYFPDPLKANVKPTPPNTPKIGSIEIQVQSLNYGFSPDVVKGLLQFIADWAALGAKGQMGFGVVEPVKGRIDPRPLYEQLAATAGSRQYTDLPSLKNIFLARIQLKKARDVDTFNLKYDLRRLFAEDKALRHFIMGTAVKNGRMAAKVKISRPYGVGLMRVWGWVPEEAKVYGNSWNRNKVVNAIYNHLNQHYDVQVWREMASPRDTVLPNTVDTGKFLQSLLGIEEG